MVASVEKGLPANLEAERLTLGAIMNNESTYVQAAGELAAQDFSVEGHRRVFQRMGDLYGRGEKIDRVTVTNELHKHGELESVGGIGYVATLDDGLPQIFNIESYFRIVKDKSLLRQIVYSSQRLMDQAMQQGTEPSVLLDAASKNILEMSSGASKPGFSKPMDIIAKRGGPNAYLNRTDTHGLNTGFTRFDRMTGGLQKGLMYVVAARPAMGKTAWAGNVIEHIALKANPGRVNFFSLEMPEEQILDRLICSRARVNLSKFLGGHLNTEEKERAARAMNDVARSPIHVDDSALRNPRDMHAAIRRQQAEGEVALVVVDFLQRMIHGDENRVSEATAVSGDLAAIAKDCKVPMLVLSQLSRGPETRQGDHRPNLSDLRETGAIEQDAFLVAFLFREEYYKRDREDLKGLAELIVGKNRNGPDGMIPLVFLREIVKFENRAEDNE